MIQLFVVALFTLVHADNNASYVVVVPKSVRGNSDFVLDVTLLRRVTTDVTVTATLSDLRNTAIASAHQTLSTAEVHARITLKLPRGLTETTYLLTVVGRGGLDFEEATKVTTTSKTLSLFVQTDKAIYKPGQKVLYRVVSVNPDLKPFRGPVNVSVFDMSGNKIQQILNRVNESGVIGGELQLSDQTPLGNWKIKVSAEGNEFEKTFEVSEYVLPKFKVSLDLPSYYFINT